MSQHRPDSALIEDALDAARVVDDYVRGVLGLSQGEVGGGNDVRRSWTQRVLTGWVYTERHVVQGMSGLHGSEQLRKAANAADDLVTAVGALGASPSDPVLRAFVTVTDLGVDTIPTQLRDADAGHKSSLAKQVHEQLSRIISALNDARSKVLLSEMRTDRPGHPPM